MLWLEQRQNLYHKLAIVAQADKVIICWQAKYNQKWEMLGETKLAQQILSCDKYYSIILPQLLLLAAAVNGYWSFSSANALLAKKCDILSLQVSNDMKINNSHFCEIQNNETTCYKRWIAPVLNKFTSISTKLKLN